MNRETKEIITPVDKHKVILNAWITGRENRELKTIVYGGMKVENSRETSINLTGEIIKEAEDKAMELMVVSVNDKTENKVDTILDMKSLDFSFVIKEINKITKDEDFLESPKKP